MLQSLHIKNFAIIEDILLSFNNGLTIITGETGAGKSLILDALGLVLGNRADIKAKKTDTKSTVIEAHFLLKDHADRFNHYLDGHNDLFLRRVISPSGRSRAFVNDIPINLSELSQISSILIDIHKQFDNSWLFSKESQLQILDSLANNSKILVEYTSLFDDYKSKIKALNVHLERRSQLLQERDYTEFQLNELNEAELDEVDLNVLTKSLEKLNNTTSITETIVSCMNTISVDENNVLDQLRALISQISSLPYTDKEIEGWLSIVNNSYEEFHALQAEMQNTLSDTEMNPEQLHLLNEKYDSVQKLLYKYGFQETTDLIELRDSLSVKVQDMDGIDTQITILEEETEQIYKTLWEKAEVLHSKRLSICSGLSKKITDRLKRLSMKDASFEVALINKEELDKDGCTQTQFLFTANKGQVLRPMQEVASGGERSRLALCIKSTVAGKMVMPTLIFDEIDNGVSGEVSFKMSKILHELSQGHQVICITHSPQIAAAGKQHLYIFKKNVQDRTVSKVISLEYDARIQELAKMLSGDPPTESAIGNALDLLGKPV